MLNWVELFWPEKLEYRYPDTGNKQAELSRALKHRRLIHQGQGAEILQLTHPQTLPV